MVEKSYTWPEGAEYKDHTKRKHKILREYIARYLIVRCQLPKRTRFRMAIVDGFAGGGRYACGSPGSPIIFIEELQNAVVNFNLQRSVDGMPPLDIECLLVLNDEDTKTINFLKYNIAPLEAIIKEKTPRLQLRIEFRNQNFGKIYSDINKLLQDEKYRNVLFMLDQCGHSHVDVSTIYSIMKTFPSSEIFYTFMVQSLITFLAKSDPFLLSSQLSYLGVSTENLRPLDGMIGKHEWLGTAERLVFEVFKGCATYVSPFSIHNPKGWRYWLIHFASSYRARQEYNNILHKNSTMQAHFGRSGLNMLAYNKNDEGSLYLFDLSGRAKAKNDLADDIPRLVTEFGDALGVLEFYETIYKMTPAHTDDIHAAIMENPDLEVITESGGERRTAHNITTTDVLRVRRQRSFFPFFIHPTDKKE